MLLVDFSVAVTPRPQDLSSKVVRATPTSSAAAPTGSPLQKAPTARVVTAFSPHSNAVETERLTPLDRTMRAATVLLASTAAVLTGTLRRLDPSSKDVRMHLRICKVNYKLPRKINMN